MARYRWHTFSPYNHIQIHTGTFTDPWNVDEPIKSIPSVEMHANQHKYIAEHFPGPQNNAREQHRVQSPLETWFWGRFERLRLSCDHSAAAPAEL